MKYPHVQLDAHAKAGRDMAILMEGMDTYSCRIALPLGMHNRRNQSPTHCGEAGYGCRFSK